MEWFKQKKEEAKQVAAKIQNKRTAFKGEGNVLGGGNADCENTSSSASSTNGKTGFKLPFQSNTTAVSEEEKRKRREAQMRAAENRVNAWDKRVNTARQARLQKEEETENTSTIATTIATSSSSSPTNRGPPVHVMSNEQVKARELEMAQAQLGFNPYAATFSSSNEAGSAMNSIGNSVGTPHPILPPPAPFTPLHPTPLAPESELDEAQERVGAVFVLLRQEPARAIEAAETILKMLSNILQNPSEDKFRRIRLNNAKIQTKLVQVKGAIDLLIEAGFQHQETNGERFLDLSTQHMDIDMIQSVIDRTEVALMQLRVDNGS